MRKSLAQAVLLVSAMHGSLASALGVGDIALASSLNQPLKAFIPLRDVDGLEAAQLRVELADSQAFRNAGVDRNQFLTALEFFVEVGRDGRGRIVVTTRQPVVEPYLDFVLEVRWPNGRMLREYTVLLDLPVFESDAAPPRPAQVPASKPENTSSVERAAPVAREPGGSRGSVVAVPPVPTAAPAASGLRPRPAAQKTELPASVSEGEYRVQHHDTMWQIAARLRPSSYVTTEQTMIALLRKNPDAFIGNNINRVKSGYVLVAPSADEAKALDQNEALKEIRRQASDWRERRSSAVKAAPSASDNAKPLAPQLDATKAAEKQPAAGESSDEVRFSIGSAGDSASGEQVDTLRQRLREEREVLEKVQLENASMASRVREMEKQVDTLQKLIALKNRELAALQSGLAAQAKPDSDEIELLSAEIAEVESGLLEDQQALAEREEAIAAVVAEGAAGGDGMSDGGPTAGSGGGVPQNDSLLADAGAVGELGAESAESADSAPVVNAPAAAKPWYQTRLYQYVAGALGALLLLLVALRRRAKQDVEADSAENLEDLPPISAVDDFANIDVETPADIASEVFDESAAQAPEAAADDSAALDFDFDSLDDSADGSTLGEAWDAESAPQEEPQETLQPQTSDAISEAEIYVAYGRYDQAASLLKSAIANEPDNTQLQLKLLDIYLDTRDQQAFLDGYRQLEALGDSAALAQVKESMSAIEGVSHWLDDDRADVEPAAGNALDDLDEELSFLDDDGTAFADSGDEPVEPASVDESGAELQAEEFNLELDEDFDLDALAATDAEELTAEFDSADRPVEGEEATSADEVELEPEAELGQAFEAEAEAGSPSPQAASEDFVGDFELDKLDDVDLSSATTDSPLAEESSDSLGAEFSDFDFDLDSAELESLEGVSESKDDGVVEKRDDTDALDLDDLDSALAELDVEVAGLSLDDADADEQLIDALVDADADADADADVDAGAEMGDRSDSGEQPLDLDELVFDEFSADALSDDEISPLSDNDDIANKLDLARAFVDMGDGDSARDILSEVLVGGSDEQVVEAKALLDQLS